MNGVEWAARLRKAVDNVPQGYAGPCWPLDVRGCEDVAALLEAGEKCAEALGRTRGRNVQDELAREHALAVHREASK